MRIIGLGNISSGCAYHRIFLPIQSMHQKKSAIIADTLTEEMFNEKVDIVYFNQMFGKYDIFELRKKYGFKVALDIDDYWILNNDHYLYELYQQNKISNEIIKHIREADIVTTTHERLAMLIYPYNKNVVITPNAIPYGKLQFTDSKIESEKTRLFWCGSYSHLKDSRLLLQPMKHLHYFINDKVKIIIGGYSDKNADDIKIWGDIVNNFTFYKTYDHALIRGLEPYEYYSMYQMADIAIIPLIKNDFNSKKSNLKVLEAAGKKIPAIVSECHPYLNMPVAYCRNDKDFQKHIYSYVNDPQMAKEHGEQLFNYCEKQFNYEQINAYRYECFKKLND